MSALSCGGKYFGAQPDISQTTLPLCRATAVISSTQGQPGWAATRTASTPASANSRTTSSSCFHVHCRFQYLASASTYGPWQRIHGSVFG
jgi:hypothetical protein